MKYIIKKVSDETLKVERYLKTIDTVIDIISFNINILNKSKNPDDLNLNEIKKDISKENLYKIEYVEKLIGYFETNPDESQIITAKEYLKDIKKDVLKNIYNRMILISKAYKIGKKKLSILNAILLKLKNYDENTYISENEFDIINALFKNQDINEKVLLDFLTIGKNNSAIKLREQETDSMLSRMYDDDAILSEMEKDRSEESFFDKLFNSIESIKNNKVLLEVFFKNSSLVTETLDIFKLIENNKSFLTNEILETADLFKDNLELIDENDMYVNAIALRLVSAIGNRDLDDAKKILEAYRIKSNEFNEMSSEQELINLQLIRFNKLMDEYYDEDEFIKFSTSYDGYTKEEIIDLVGELEYTKMSIMNMFFEFKNTLENVSSNTLENIINTLLSEIQKYTLLKKSSDDIELPEEIIDNGLDIENVLNYIVVLNQDRLRANIEQIVNDYPEVNISLFSKAINKLLLIPHEELYSRKTCKPIKTSVNINNPYDIREERAGIIRIGFKSINTKDGHVVYEVLSFAYGSCDGKAKSDNLKTSIKEYENYIEDYSQLEKEIKSSNLGQVSNHITAGLTFYNELIDECKKVAGDELC